MSRKRDEPAGVEMERQSASTRVTGRLSVKALRPRDERIIQGGRVIYLKVGLRQSFPGQ